MFETVLFVLCLFVAIDWFMMILYRIYMRNYYLESEQAFEERIKRLCNRDGNHMVLITALHKDRKRRQANRSRLRIFR